MNRRVICPVGHQWELDSSDAVAGMGLVCLFCGAPGRLDTSDPIASGLPPALQPTLHHPNQWHDTDEILPDVSNVPEVPGYRVERRLGSGGMGEVFLALQSGTGRLVALKLPRIGAGLTELARFRAEAEAVARLRHPGIVPVYEVGEAGGRMFLAMEYCPGGSLAERLDGTPLTPRLAATLLEALARAVHAAHLAGIVHRDLKPANVLLSPRHDTPELAPAALGAWVPRVSDFGLARLLDDDRGVTQPGTVLGTPTYMAPEQAFGDMQNVGPLADVYALGVVLYEFLTGRPPFHGASTLDTLDQVRTRDPVPPTRLQPTVPRDLETICLKCLHKEPARRYSSSETLAEDLSRFLSGRPVLARPVSPAERFAKWVRRNPRVAALAGLLVSAILAGFIGVGIYQYRLARQRDRAVHHLQVAMRSVDGLLTGVAEEDLAVEPLAESRRRALLDKALVLYQELLQFEGDNAALREETALAARRVGDIQRQLGRYPEAHAAYAKALKQFEPLAAESPGRSELRRKVADCHNFTGEVYRLTARPKEAAAEYRQARDIQQSIADAEPENAAVRRELARSRYNLGLVNRDANHLPEARVELEGSASLLRDLKPDDLERRWHLARALMNLGSVLRLLNNSDQAFEAYEESIALYEALVAQVPARPQFRHELAKVLINRANLRRREPKSLLRARDLLTRLADDFPQTPEHRSDLATACNGLAAAAFVEKDWAAAERWLAESAAAWQKLLVTHGSVPDHHAGLGIALGNLGRVMLTRSDARKAAAAAIGFAALAVEGEFVSAQAALEQGIREVAIALRANPEQPDCRASLRQQCGDLARLAAILDDTALTIGTANMLAEELPTASVGPAYAAYLLARYTSLHPGTTRECTDRAFALLHLRSSADLASLEKFLIDPVFDPFRQDPRFEKFLPPRK